MSKLHEYERAFFSSLCDYNAQKSQVDTLKVGLIATLMGQSITRHVERYYPDCARN